jgi:hypothetical protein
MVGRLRRPGAGLRRDAIRRNRHAPYVNGADLSETVPFLDIGDRHILAGAQYDPQVLADLSQAQIASRSAMQTARWPKPLTGQPT